MREARVVHRRRARQHHRGRGEDVHDVDPDQEDPVRVMTYYQWMI